MWLPEVTGPDGIPVTVRVEPAVARWDRTAYKLALTPALLLWLPKVRSSLKRGMQDGPMRGKWAVDVESDGGVKIRLITGSREEAVALGEKISADVALRGQAALADHR